MKRPINTRWRLTKCALLAITVAITGTACSFQPADLPVPGTGVGGSTYHLRIEFANVLNLPRGAKVISDGVRVGQLTDVTVVNPVTAASEHSARGGYVIAGVDISSAVRLAAGTTAELRQETPLGDVHIALTGPTTPSSSQLAPDAVIPLSDTAQSPQIEDIMARLSTFIGTGAVTEVQDIVRRMNAVMPDDPQETAHIAATLGADLINLGEHHDAIHTLVAGLRSTVEDGLLANTPILDPLLTPEGIQHTTDSINTTIGVIFVLTALGPVAPSITWLGPMLHALDGTVQATVPMLFGAHPLDTSSPSNLKKLVDLIQNKVIPFADRGPKLNLVGVTVDSPGAPALNPEEQTTRIIDTLRMIGAVQ